MDIKGEGKDFRKGELWGYRSRAEALDPAKAGLDSPKAGKLSAGGLNLPDEKKLSEEKA
jgi:hypothetical protein